jgi:ABC-type multidrug transport system fused ATPase/permease subunit
MKKMRETMKIMGLRTWVHQSSWFITAFVLFFWISVTTTFFTTNSFLPNSDPSIIFAYFFLFFMSEVTLSFVVSVFFSNAKLAAICGPVVLLFLILPKFIFFNTTDNESVRNKVLASLLSPTAFCFGADIIADYEYGNVGVQFSNLNNTGYNMQTCLNMMLVDFILYAVVAWYLDQVIPHEYGAPRHPLFIFQWSFWLEGCDCCRSNMLRRDIENNAYMQLIDEYNASSEEVEPLAVELRPRVKVAVNNLRKQYDDGKVAINDMNLRLVEGQITCLLGHNGAGKSTTISILTGTDFRVGL